MLAAPGLASRAGTCRGGSTMVATSDPTTPPSTAAMPSGRAWVARFPTSASVADCAQPFRDNLNAFLAALGAAGANVNIAATLRPLQRAYLMHWCWSIVKQKADPR